MNMKLLEDVTVLELTTYWAATGCGRFLRTMGARVIRVETPPKGDPCRYFGRVYKMPITDEENPIHDMYNGGKECITLDLTKSEDAELFHKMLAKADIFLTSTREKGLKKLGLDWDTLKVKYPRLVMAHSTGWGKEGPLSRRPGLDAIAFMSSNGVLSDLRLTDNTPPIYSPPGFGDLSTGTMLAVGALAALHRREITGKGDYVMASLYGTGNWVTSPVSVATEYGYEWPRTVYNSGPMSQAYRCKDGNEVLTYVNEYDKVWPAFSRAYGLEDLDGDPRYNCLAGTLVPENREALIKIIQERALKRDSQEILDLLVEGDVPACIVRHFKDKYEGELLEQNVVNGYLSEHTYPSGKNVYLSQMPLFFSSEGVKDLYEPHRALNEDGKTLREEFGTD